MDRPIILKKAVFRGVANIEFNVLIGVRYRL